MAGPLTGQRVLDFCWIGAGAIVTKALAELGAEVIRIESRAHPDNLRLAPPFRPGTGGLEASGYFASRNPGKKSVALNMKKPEAREIALDLAEHSTIVSSNFRPGVMEKWGLSYEDVRARRPEIIYLVMPMQGTDGPHSRYIGFGSTIAALSGLVALTGLRERVPVGTGTHYPDHVPNPGHALVGLLAALLHRDRTGEGQRVELSQLESTINIIGPAVLQASAGSEPTPTGNRSPFAVPHGVFKTAEDSWVVVECHDDDQWARLVGVLGRPEWATDARFVSRSARREHEDLLEEMLSAEIARLPRKALLADLVDAGVPSGPVNTSADVLGDVRLVKRGFWHEVDHPVIGSMPMFRLPIQSDRWPRGPLERPPLLGEHTWEIASSVLGFSRTEYDRLVAEEVFY